MSVFQISKEQLEKSHNRDLLIFLEEACEENRILAANNKYLKKSVAQTNRVLEALVKRLDEEALRKWNEEKYLPKRSYEKSETLYLREQLNLAGTAAYLSEKRIKTLEKENKRLLKTLDKAKAKK